MVSAKEDTQNMLPEPGPNEAGVDEASRPRPVVGQMYGSYRIEERFSQQSTSDVYRAYDVQEERYLALRVLSGTFTPDSDVVKDFRWSMRAVERVEHPHLLKVEKMELTPDGQLFLVMPSVSGQSLAQRLEQIREQGEGVSPAAALAFVRPVAQALAVAHRAGVVHMMLTPREIIIESDGLPHLMGLDTPGTLYDLAPQESDGEDFSRYLSPEQRQGRALDGRSNIYSLGVMLYELLTAEMWQVQENAAERPLPAGEAWGGLPEITRHIVNTCLRPEAWARFRTVEEFLLAVDTALLDEAHLTPDALALISDEELSKIAEEISSLEESTKSPPPGKHRRERRLWPYPLVALGLLLVGLMVFRPQEDLSPAVDDDDAQLLEQPVGQETLDALASPQSLQLTPTLSVLGNMLTARALAAPAMPGVAATPTFIPTPTATPTDTPTPTPTDTPTPTNTPTPTPTPTFTRIPPTLTPIPTATFTPAPIIPTDTPAPPPGGNGNDGGGGNDNPPPPPTDEPPTPPPPPTATPPLP